MQVSNDFIVGIACWLNKYKFNYWRPVTAFADPNWTPLLVTPPFPEYVSGHSSFSGAASHVLLQYFPNNIGFSLTYFGQTRSFKTLVDAAKDAGKSRIYGGIHFEFSNTPALENGKNIAYEVIQSHY